MIRSNRPLVKNMKHNIVFKDKNRYSSFPLLTKLEDRILIGFFTAPISDHMGLFEWIVLESFDKGENWEDVGAHGGIPYHWPAMSARERSDRFTATLFDGTKIIAGSFGFAKYKNRIFKSRELFLKNISENGKAKTKRWMIPNTDIVATFPRPLILGNIILIPGYLVLKNKLNKSFVFRSSNRGKDWRLYNMFPDEINANEIAFVWANKEVLAHIRSDTNPYIMESWSDDGITWTYPTNIYCKSSINNCIAGGPSHLLRLNDGRIIDSYGYRFDKMGIKAIVSEDEGQTWNKPIILREDGGYLSSLHKRKWWQRKVYPGNDVGYPISIELDDGQILTAYYITTDDNITHIATTKWEV